MNSGENGRGEGFGNGKDGSNSSGSSGSNSNDSSGGEVLEDDNEMGEGSQKSWNSLN